MQGVHDETGISALLPRWGQQHGINPKAVTYPLRGGCVVIRVLRNFFAAGQVRRIIGACTENGVSSCDPVGIDPPVLIEFVQLSIELSQSQHGLMPQALIAVDLLLRANAFGDLAVPLPGDRRLEPQSGGLGCG